MKSRPTNRALGRLLLPFPRQAERSPNTHDREFLRKYFLMAQSQGKRSSV